MLPLIDERWNGNGCDFFFILLYYSQGDFEVTLYVCNDNKKAQKKDKNINLIEKEVVTLVHRYRSQVSSFNQA